MGLLSSYTLNQARMANDASRAAQAASAQGVAPLPFEALLRELVDEQNYPRLYRIAHTATIGPNPSGFDEREEFEFGIDRILDGVERLIERSHPPRRA